MIINKYRIEKAYICYQSCIKWTNFYWSVNLALYWFSSGFDFNGDNPKLAAKRATL